MYPLYNLLYLFIKMISVGNWDNSYIYKPISKVTPDGDNVRVISNTDGNQISWVQTGRNTESFTLNRGTYNESRLCSLLLKY